MPRGACARTHQTAPHQHPPHARTPTPPHRDRDRRAAHTVRGARLSRSRTGSRARLATLVPGTTRQAARACRFTSALTPCPLPLAPNMPSPRAAPAPNGGASTKTVAGLGGVLGPKKSATEAAQAAAKARAKVRSNFPPFLPTTAPPWIARRPSPHPTRRRLQAPTPLGTTLQRRTHCHASLQRRHSPTRRVRSPSRRNRRRNRRRHRRPSCSGKAPLGSDWPPRRCAGGWRRQQPSARHPVTLPPHALRPSPSSS